MVAPPEDHVPRDEWDWKSNGLPETRFIYSIPVLPDPLISQTSQDPPKPSLQTLTKTRSGSYPPAGRDALRTFSLALSLSLPDLSPGPLRPNLPRSLRLSSPPVSLARPVFPIAQGASIGPVLIARRAPKSKDPPIAGGPESRAARPRELRSDGDEF